MSTSARIDELRKKFDENPRRYFAPLANEYRKAGDPDQAIFICEEYLPQQPGHMSGHIVYGQALFEAKRLEEARAVFETALGLDPENLIALRHLGDIALQTTDSAGARGWYQRVLEADPRNEEIAELLNRLLQEPVETTAPPARKSTPAASQPPEEARPAEWLGDVSITQPIPAIPMPRFSAPRIDAVAAEPEPSAPPAPHGDVLGDQVASTSAGSGAETEEPELLDFQGMEFPAADAPADVAATADATVEVTDSEDTGQFGVGQAFESDHYAVAGFQTHTHDEVPSPASVRATPHASLDGFEATQFAEPPAEEPHAEEPHAEEPHAEEPQAEEPHADELYFEEPQSAEPSVLSADGDATSFDETLTVDEQPAATEEVVDDQLTALQELETFESFDVPATPAVDEGPPIAEDRYPEQAPDADQFPEPAPIDGGHDDFDVGVGAASAASNEGPDPSPVSQLLTPVASQPSVRSSGPFVTETMAQLYLQQGHREEALEIYRILIEQRPNDAALRARFEAADAPAPTAGIEIPLGTDEGWEATSEFGAAAGPTGVVEPSVEAEPIVAYANVDGVDEPIVDVDEPIVEDTMATELEPAVVDASDEVDVRADAGPTIREFLQSLFGVGALSEGENGAVAPDEEVAPASFDAEVSDPIDGPPARDESSTPTPVASMPAAPSAVAESPAMRQTPMAGTPAMRQTPMAGTPAVRPTPMAGTPALRPTPAAGVAALRQTPHGSLEALFLGALPSEQDQTAASVLAEAFPADDALPLRGMPAHKASGELSLESVFKSDSPSRPGRRTGGFSLEQFFGADASQNAGGTGGSAPPSGDASTTPMPDSDDVEQFNAWLEGLKKS